MLQLGDDLISLCGKMRDHHYSLTLETSGSVEVDSAVTDMLSTLQLLSISPKLHKDWASVTNLITYAIDNVGAIQLKVVVEDPKQAEDAMVRLMDLHDQTLKFFNGSVVYILQPEYGKGIEWSKKLSKLVLRSQQAHKFRVIPQVHRLMGAR